GGGGASQDGLSANPRKILSQIFQRRLHERQGVSQRDEHIMIDGGLSWREVRKEEQCYACWCTSPPHHQVSDPTSWYTKGSPETTGRKSTPPPPVANQPPNITLET